MSRINVQDSCVKCGKNIRRREVATGMPKFCTMHHLQASNAHRGRLAAKLLHVN